MKLLVFLVYATLALGGRSSWSAVAESFSGIIVRKPLRIELLTSTDSFRLIPRDSFVETDLKKLKTGDFLQGYGLFNKNKILVSSVDIVGLKNLLGRWISDDETILDFTGFTGLNVYVPSRSKPDGYEKPVHLSYSLSPDEGDKWGILLNSNTAVQTGLIHLEKSDEMSISIRDLDRQLHTIYFNREQ